MTRHAPASNHVVPRHSRSVILSLVLEVARRTTPEHDSRTPAKVADLARLYVLLSASVTKVPASQTRPKCQHMVGIKQGVLDVHDDVLGLQGVDHLLLTGHTSNDTRPPYGIHLLRPRLKRLLGSDEVATRIEDVQTVLVVEGRPECDRLVACVLCLGVDVGAGLLPVLRQEHPVFEERGGRDSSDGLFAESRKRLPGDGLAMTVEDEVDVALLDRREVRIRRLVLLVLQDGADVDDQLCEERLMN